MSTYNKKRRFRSKELLQAVIILAVIQSVAIYIVVRRDSDDAKARPNTTAYHDSTQAEVIPAAEKETPAPTQSPTPEPAKSPQPALAATPVPTPSITPAAPVQDLPSVPISEGHFKDFFKNSVYIGDSISEGLSYFEFLEDTNVVARRGLNLYSAQSEIDTAAAVNPESIFILFGANDMVGGDSCETFINAYKGLLNEIRQKIPNGRIYIQSILPVTAATGESNPALSKARIDEFNEALVNLTKEENIVFLNIASVLNPYGESLHEGDGIHFKPPFYPLWLDYVEKALKEN